MTLPGGRPDGDKRGSNEQRKRRKIRMLKTWRSDLSIVWVIDPKNVATERNWTDAQIARNKAIFEPHGYEIKVFETCRCYRCGRLLTFESMTVDRIVPGCVKTKMFPKGGTYVDWNIRPACSGCNTETGLLLAQERRGKKSTSKARNAA